MTATTVARPAARTRRRTRRITPDNAFASLALTFLTVVTAIGMCRVFSDWGFLRPMVTMAVAVHVGSLALRALRIPAYIAVPALALVMYEVIALLFYKDTMRTGLPARETLELLRVDLRLVWTQFPDAVAPVPSEGSYLVAATFGIGLVAVLADAFAFRAYGRAEAAVPSGVLFIFTAALGTDRNRVAVAALWFASAILVVALLRALHSGSDDSWLGRRGRAMGAAVPATLSCAALAAVAAAALGPLLPGAGEEPLLDTHGGDSTVTEVLSPLVDIRSRLVSRSGSEMFTVDSAVGRYWRVTGLSEFNGSTWGLRDSTLEDAGGNLNPLEPDARILQQRFTIKRFGGKLVPASFAPVAISQNDVRWLPNTDTLVYDGDSMEFGDVFNVQSDISEASPEQLRAASAVGAAPEFYDLPPNFPASVVALAQEVTASAPTPYDKAIALQNWFRTQFEYDLEVQAGHSNDAIVSFLRIRRGYCEQFAGTFGAMARAIGLPSRVAVGFTPGELQADGSYHVYGRHAHAWPEVWFDGIGWVLFEPTPGRGAPGSESTTGVGADQDDTPAPVGPAGGNIPVPSTTSPLPTQITEPNLDTPVTSAVPMAAPESSEPGQGGGTSVWTWILAVLALVGLWMIAMPGVVRRLARRGSTPAEEVIDAWHGTVGSLVLAGAPAPAGATPLEYAIRVEDQLAVDHRSLTELARFVTRAVYSPSGVGEPAALRAAVLRTQLQQSARELTPWYLRLYARLDPRLVRQQVTG